MKKAAKKTDFEYNCFPCRKQDDKARSYTRSYDLILHMVNTHNKYPVEARHNAYCAADGSDLRDATEVEREKNRLAALHKRRKLDAESSCGKSGSATAVMHDSKRAVVDTQQLDSRRREGDLSRDRDDRGTHHREAGDKGVRPVAIPGKDGKRLTEIVAGPTWAGVRKRGTMNGNRLIGRKETKPR